MKVVQLLPELNEGGVERGTADMNRALISLGYQSIVISNGGKLVAQIESDGGNHILFDVCSKNPLTVLTRMLKLRKIFKELNPDIVHARSRVPAWLTYMANKSLHIPFVTTVHGFNSASPYSRIMSMGDRVICVSNSIKEYIQKHYHTSEAKLTVVPRGIDLEKFNPNHLDQTFIQSFMSQYELHEKFVVSVVGRVTQLKDLETFIRAIAKIKETIPNVKALIVGGVREDKQGYFESLKTLIRELELGDDVVFTGSQSNIAEIYALSDVVVSASKKPESFGRSVAEAIAMNTPVIATNHGGVLDIIREGENGYFIPIGDAETLAKKIVEAKQLHFDGFTYIRAQFSLEQMVEKTVEIYQSLNKGKNTI